MFWKHKEHDATISSDCLSKLPEDKKSNFEETEDEPTHQVTTDDSGNFALSMVVGELTGSSIMGGLIGGDMLGGMLGSSFSL